METHDRDNEQLMSFAVDASILVQLGEQLVTRRSIALAELIKNAYDADATHVHVILENITKPGGMIVVHDDGVGMTLDSIRQYWMRIATNNKKTSSYSTVYNRVRTGQKGIGRFAVHRLAKVLTLVSVAEESDGIKYKTTMEFDWEKTFLGGQVLSNIPIGYKTEAVDSATTGVTLYLEDARDGWSESDIADVWKDLVSLTNPFFDPSQESHTFKAEDPGITITIEVPEYKDYEGALQQQFLGASWCELSGFVDEDGHAHYQLKIRQSDEEQIFEPTTEIFPDISGIDTRIYFFVYKREFLSDVDFAVRDIQRVGTKQGGIRVYQDRFRVFPYGEPGNDWLRLDEIRARRTTGFDVGKDLIGLEKSIAGRPELLTPGNNQLFGVVNVSQQQHPKLVVTTNREGFAENEALSQLRRFVQLGLWWMTLNYARATQMEREQRRAARKPDEKKNVSELIADIKRVVENTTTIPLDVRSRVTNALEMAEQEATNQEDRHIDEISLLRVLSSTGTTVSMVDHQLREMINVVEGIITDLGEFSSYVDNSMIENYATIVNRLENWKYSVQEQVASLGFLLGEKNRRERERALLHVVVTGIANSLTRYMSDFGIEFINEIPVNLHSPLIYPAELYAVMLHVFTNSLKAVREQSVSKIAMQGERTPNGVYVRVLDTGAGIPDEDREIVFRPFHPRIGTPDPILGTGTGLGLKIVRDILANYNGTVRFIDAPEPWTTCLEIFLPE
ncbi:MAG TPA: ATP-binding protein [Aggregatilinea sp.]|uniref:ATP-binding protein n=1 Tax=Aggregatilinea sp. TaxID=2806333 RepID=UPI002CA5499C|nr:ATP-binding protein [Aggregatilinea sp.]HML22077.1 ATP-binding protein [Aggregatilinea sp.]